MDIESIRTFLAIYDLGTFQAASVRLNVTQSTISMRVKTLEERMRVRLFERSKAGATPTVEGRRFQRFARSIILAWEEGRQQAGLPAQFDSLLSIGGQYSLWNELLLPFLPRLRERLPRIALRAEAAAPFGLMRRLSEGLLDIAILYRPDFLPNLRVEKLLDDELVLVTADAARGSERFVQIDWGRAFSDQNEAQYLDLVESGVTLDLGFLSANYLIDTGSSGYMPRRMIRSHLAAGRLHEVPGAPSYDYPVSVVFQVRNEPEGVTEAIDELKRLAIEGA